LGVEKYGIGERPACVDPDSHRASMAVSAAARQDSNPRTARISLEPSS
jgi:hypothetical protein